MRLVMKKALPIATLMMTILAAPAFANDKDTVKQNLQQADANGDKALNYKEFVTFIDLNAADNIGRASMVKSRNLYSRAFKRLDKNRDGKITRAEIKR